MKYILIYKSRYWPDKPFETFYEVFDSHTDMHDFVFKKLGGRDVNDFPNNQRFEICLMCAVDRVFNVRVKETVKELEIV